MYLNPIFVDEESGEGLYAMVHEGESQDEYERLFDLWDDAEYIFDYLLSNEEYIKTDYFQGAEPEDIAQKISKEAEELEILIEEHFFDPAKTLQMLFVPIGKQTYIPRYQETKAFVNDRRYFPKPILRIYAIRISENTFVISGGAIKLVHAMSDHADTKKELEKLLITKAFLSSNGFNTFEDFKIII
jgi:hypothetical protein